MLRKPDLLCQGFVFPESPRWHRGSFYCTSIDEGTIFRIDEDGGKEVVLQIDDGRTLLITASDSHDRKVIRDHPSGRLFTVHVEVPGAGLPSFN